jgi:DNA ligase-associated metallophosphoesterase
MPGAPDPAPHPAPADRLALDLEGERIELLAARAAWWPARRTLLVADIHLGKADALRAAGAALPHQAILERQLRQLDALVACVDARRLLILGDVLHAAVGLTDELVGAVEAWAAATPVRLEAVRGNHDRALDRVASRWRMTLHPDLHAEGPFDFTHHPPSAVPDRFTWCGHLHPAVSIGSRVAPVKLHCFVLDARVAVLPAFTLFASGKTLPPAPGRRIVAIAQDSLFELPGRHAASR